MPAVIVACFVVSGATSLVLQVVWVRQLIDVFGSSSLAISTVLAAFMGGLALGAWLGGRLADRLRERARSADPLWAYAACEAAVGASALVIPLVVGHYRGANAWLWGHLGDAPARLAVARFALSGLLLLVPTTCMGATLPLLSRRLTQHAGDLGALGRRVGALYAANTGGAVVGAGFAGFALIPWLGVRGTNALAATAALALASAIALALAARHRRAHAAPCPDAAATAEATPPEPGAAAFATLVGERRLAVAAFGISGGVAMALEVLWSRTLAQVLGSSTYSFTLVLVAFLIGLAVGAWLIARRAATSRAPLRALGRLFVAIAASVMLTHQLADQLPAILVALLGTGTLSVGSALALHALIAALFILPTALGLGAVMPLVVRVYAGEFERVGGDVGRAYAANTVGAIVGSFAGGFVILPVVGLEPGIRLAAAAEGALGALLIARAGSRRGALVAGTALALAVLALPGWNKSRLTAGVFRYQVAKRYLDAGELFDRPIIFYEDGIATTVTVEQGRGPILKNNGKVEASTVHDMPTQILVGLMPVLLHGGDGQSVFVIGYGSGITVGAIAQSPQPARIDAVELEPAVYRAADRFFGAYNHRPEADRRVRRKVGDGRNALLAGDRVYDVIVSEPSNPWIAGVASLFTREFYAFAKQHLAADGVFCQWAQLYELGPHAVKTIYRTFAEAFPYVYAFATAEHSSDTLLVGSRRPLAFDLAALDRRFTDSGLAAELRRAQIDRPEQLIANFLLGPDEIGAFTAGADVNTDDNALLEYAAPRDLLDEARERIPMATLIFSDTWPYGRLAPLLAPAPAADRWLVLARDLLATGRRREAELAVAQARERGATDAAVARLAALVRLTRRRGFAEPELALASLDAPMPAPAPELFEPASDEAARALREVYGLVALGRWEDAWSVGRALPARTPTDAGRDVDLVLGFTAYKSLALASASRLLAPLADDPERAARRPAALYFAGRAAYGQGRFRRGVALMDRLAASAPGVAADAAR
jgi:spermidine synthase